MVVRVNTRVPVSARASQDGALLFDFDRSQLYEDTAGDKSTLVSIPGRLLGHQVDDHRGNVVRYPAAALGMHGTQRYPKAVRQGKALTRAMTFTDLFYGRLHLNPSFIDMGNLLTAQTRQAELWNASFGSVALGNIAASGTDGVDLSLPMAVPLQLAPLQAVQIDLAVSTSGPTNLDASYLFDADSLKDVVLRVVGTRAVVFPIQPATDNSYTEKLEWVSDVLTAYDGSEQRMAVNDWPDTQITMTVHQHAEVIHLLDSLLWGWQHRIYSLPLWHRGTFLSAPAFVETSSVPCPTEHAGFRVGGIGIIWHAHDRFETFEVLEIHPDRIATRRPLQNSWGAGSVVSACRPARLPQEVSVSWDHADLAKATLNFVLTEVEVEEPYEFSPNYRGVPLLLEATNWVQAMAERNVRNLDVFETDLRARYTVLKNEVPSVVRSHSWFLKGKARIHQFRRWLYSRRGRVAPFWAPSWKADLALAERIEQGDLTITVRDINYRGLYRYNEGRKDLIIFLRGGRHLTRRIVSAAAGQPGSKTEVLMLDAEIGEVIEPSSISMICFLGLYRLDADAVELDWRSDQLALCTQNMRLLTDGV